MADKIIYPRSPRETMCGWMHLPRYLDKIRLHLAGRLSTDYQENFGKGFDGRWLQSAGLAHDQFIEVCATRSVMEKFATGSAPTLRRRRPTKRPMRKG